MATTVTRTYVGSIQYHRQVQNGLGSLGDSASKILNVARWPAGRIWDETGEIPDEGPLKAYMKNPVHLFDRESGMFRTRE